MLDINIHDVYNISTITKEEIVMKTILKSIYLDQLGNTTYWKENFDIDVKIDLSKIEKVFGISLNDFIESRLIDTNNLKEISELENEAYEYFTDKIDFNRAIDKTKQYIEDKTYNWEYFTEKIIGNEDLINSINNFETMEEANPDLAEQLEKLRRIGKNFVEGTLEEYINEIINKEVYLLYEEAYQRIVEEDAFSVGIDKLKFIVKNKKFMTKFENSDQLVEKLTEINKVYKDYTKKELDKFKQGNKREFPQDELTNEEIDYWLEIDKKSEEIKEKAKQIFITNDKLDFY